MRWIGIALVAFAALAGSAWAGEAEDAAYQAAVAAAMQDPAAADYGELRTLYAASSFYKGSASDPFKVIPYWDVSRPPPTQAMKDEGKAQLQVHYALPGAHTAFANLMNYRRGMPEWDRTRAVVQGLLDAITESGDGDSAETALKVLAKNEPAIILERLGLENMRGETVEQDGRVFYVSNARQRDPSWFSWFKGNRQVWFDITPYQDR